MTFKEKKIKIIRTYPFNKKKFNPKYQRLNVKIPDLIKYLANKVYFIKNTPRLNPLYNINT